MWKRVCLGCAVAVLSTGCATTFAPPQELPTLRVDEEASEVTVRNASGEKVPEEAASKVRTQVREILDAAVAERPDLTAARPARFKASVVVRQQLWPLAACLAVLTLFGCPAAITEAELTLTLDVGGERFVGRGKGQHAASIYYNGDGYQSVRRALEAALKDAVSKRQGSAG